MQFALRLKGQERIMTQAETGILIIVVSFALAIGLAWRGAQKEKENNNH
jgi:hypothetical protein